MLSTLKSLFIYLFALFKHITGKDKDNKEPPKHLAASSQELETVFLLNMLLLPSGDTWRNPD